jgi:hypothetical protein
VTKATHTGYTLGMTTQVRGSASYVTGAHAFKVGFQVAHVSRDIWQSADANNNLINYRFNKGAPNQITEYAKPYDEQQVIKADLGIYAQDRWTVKRLTASLGLRWDYFNDYFPPQTVGPGPLTPLRQISFPETPSVNWKDFSPRLGLAYDAFGDGKTAVKVSLNRYVLATGLQGLFGQGSNPVQLMANTITRVDRQRRRRWKSQRLHPQLRFDQPAGQRRMRQGVGHQLREHDEDHRDRSVDYDRLGQARLRLGVLGRRPAAGDAAHVGRGHLLPALVRQLLRHG